MDSKVVLKVPRRRNLDQTALDVIIKYVNRLMFPSKHFINQAVKRALEFFIMRQMIMKLDNELYPESHSLINYFYDEMLVSKAIDDNILECVDNLEEISKRGLLEVLLTVYWEFQKQIQNDMPQDSILKESMDVFDFIASIASKNPREKAYLIFKGKVVKLGVILISVQSEHFVEYYCRCIKSYSKEGIKMIFVLGAGLSNCQAAKLVAEDFVRRNCGEWKIMAPVETRILSRKNRRTKSICILIKRCNKNSTSSV